jgi:hypothetical protein
MRARVALVVLALALGWPESVRAADEAAPLPSRDVRWYVSDAVLVDVGSLPRASPGLALGGGVQRGGLGASVVASGLLAQDDRASHTPIALYDLVGTVCALAPLGRVVDLGGCGGGGAGLLRVSRSLRRGAGDIRLAPRPEGVATARLDLHLGRALVLSLDGGAVVAPWRPTLVVDDLGTSIRPAWLGFRGSLGLHLRLW